VIDVIADGLAITGLAVLLWARVTLGSNWSGSVVFKENHELVTRGPYAFVRHPIYTGLLTMVLGDVIFSGVVGGIVWFVILFMLLWLKSRAEESLMTRHFPAEYPAYRGRVKALVPFVF
jgi:protein-S-isoprenylcysteine O-methyltransferase Ste14